ncbi:MAG: ATP-binding protein [Deltaproteobacteria bacterium]|nr:ATP-binding protein [Deltaproteobacteria bacterium]
MIKRKSIEDIEGHLSAREISLIVGPRQAGKTTLMLMVKDRLDREGHKTLFLSLDFDSERPFFASQGDLLRKIRLEIGERNGYVFIDEIQRKENAGLFLKGIHDMNLGYKFIVSGSGSLELKESIHESLVGRKRVFEVGTLSFEEFVNFKTEYRYEDRLKDFFSVEGIKARAFLGEYLMFGGYPRIVLEAEIKEKTRLIDEIYRSYLERDVSHLLRVEKVEAFSALIRILAGQMGKLVNYSELSSTLGISLNTLKNYLWYAEKTFILVRITPFFRNQRKEITKSPIYYFHDPGLRNYAVGLWGRTALASDLSFSFQNFVFSCLRQVFSLSPWSIHFWRTKDRAEVDFVIDRGSDLLPVEVKYKQMKEASIGRSLRSFIARYKPKDAWVVNLSLEDRLEMEGTMVRFLPYHALLFGQESEMQAALNGGRSH